MIKIIIMKRKKKKKKKNKRKIEKLIDFFFPNKTFHQQHNDTNRNSLLRDP